MFVSVTWDGKVWPNLLTWGPEMSNRPLIYHSGSSVILQKGYLNPRSTLEVSYIYHAYLSSKWRPKQSFTRVDQAGWLSQPCVESTHNSQVPDSIQLWVTTRLVHHGSESLSAESLGWNHEFSCDSKFSQAEFPRLWTRKPGNGQRATGRREPQLKDESQWKFPKQTQIGNRNQDFVWMER